VLVPLVLSAEQLEKLAEAGVVASPADYPEFHVLYQESVKSNLPVFVTSDALLHAYHLIFDQLLSTLEEEVFLPKLRELNQALLAQTLAEYEQLKGTAWETAAKNIYAYVAVGSRLADPEFELPEAVRDLAQAELDLIEAAGGPAPSPIFRHLKYGEDYSQYTPRGHYTKSEALKNYFKAMMWYGRMTFRLEDREDPAAGIDETRMALLLTLAVRDGKAGPAPALDLWQTLYDPTAFLVGRSDDLTLADYLQIMEQIYGPAADLTAIADDARLPSFIEAADRTPRTSHPGPVERRLQADGGGQRLAIDGPAIRAGCLHLSGADPPQGSPALSALRPGCDGGHGLRAGHDLAGTGSHHPECQLCKPVCSTHRLDGGPVAGGLDRNFLQRLAVYIASAAGLAGRGLSPVHAIDCLAGQTAEYGPGQLG